MKPGKLLAAARRELTRSPKKAAALAVLLAAAVWFWGPIVWRMGGKTKPSTALPAQAVNAKAAMTALDNHNVGREDRPAVNWRQLLAARRQDPLAQPAKFDPRWPQPFKVKLLATAGSENPAAPLALTPEQAGLVLESILYGKTKRAAMINGEIYHQGSDIVVAAATGSAVTFQVVGIERTHVALDRYGRTYQLEFPRPRLTQSPPGGRAAPLAPGNNP